MKVISIFSYSLLVLEINIFHLHLHSKPSPLMQLRTVQPSPQTAPQTLFPHLHWQTSSFYHRGLCKRGSPARSQTQPADPPVLRSATINRSLSKCLVVSAITPCRLSPSLRTFLSSPLVLKIMIIDLLPHFGFNIISIRRDYPWLLPSCHFLQLQNLASTGLWDPKHCPGC
jgi:hypothetical protein